jgi:hypothetical protein
VNVQKLGAVGLMLLGVWWLAAVLISIPTLSQAVRGEFAWYYVAWTVLELGIGFVLIRFAWRISRRLLPAEELQAGPEVAELLPMALAVAAVYALVENAAEAVRLLMPFLSAAEDASEGMLVPWEQLATVGAAVFVFWKSGWIARLILRAQPSRAHV